MVPAMAKLLFITHPEVVRDPATPVTRWGLAPEGIDRMRAFAAGPEAAGIGAIWSSTEAKAIEAAGLLGARRGLGVQVHAGLGENDRSATGYLTPAAFERMADAFFARPSESARGWERAVDAQARIVGAVSEIAHGHRGSEDLAIVAHGAVGTLLYCARAGLEISRRLDQPFQGHYLALDLPGLVPVHGWRPIAPRARPADALPGPAIVPEFGISDWAASRRFYCDLLGFSARYDRPEQGFSYLTRGRAELMIDQIGLGRTFDGGHRPDVRPFGRGVNLQIEVPSVDPLLSALEAAGHPLVLPLEERWYRAGEVELGNRQFVVADPDGYLLRFFEDLGQRPRAG